VPTSTTIRRMRKVILMLALVAACGDDDATTTDAPTAIDAPAVTLDCATYCSQITANCTGANAQYADAAHCMGTCAKFPKGTAVTETTGDTLGCRIYHSGMPSATTPATHCPHAGPGGGPVADPLVAQCGNACESFCTLEIATCGTTGAPKAGIPANYASVDACVATCNTFTKTPAYSPTAPAGNTLACRLYHVTNAAVSDTAAMTHCMHTGSPATAVCK